MIRALVLAALLLAGSTVAAAAQREGSEDLAGDSEQGRQIAEARGCFACHGETGISDDPNFPNLAGQPASYLSHQLEYFRTAGRQEAAGRSLARRRHPFMDAQAQVLEDGDIAHLAAYFASLPCAPAEGPRVPRPAIVQRCIACHGVDGMGTTVHTPNLASQKRRYLIRQLLTFQNTDKDPEKSHPELQRFHPIMSQQVRALSRRDMAAVTRYYAGYACKQ